MDQVDSFQALIFQTATLNTADVPGISQFPVGTSSKSASYTFNWVIDGAAEHSSTSKTFPTVLLLWMVIFVLLQSTLWKIPCK